MAEEKVKTWLHFLGAAGTVTGSKFLIEHGDKKILVDCGMFQGLKKLRELNWEYPPVDPKTIDVVLLTHAHLDHCGYLPRLVKQGFKGKIYSTAASLDIAEIILKDSARIQEEDAERANKSDYSKHKPAEALYDLDDVEKTLKHFVEINEGEWNTFYKDIRFRYQYNSHILGSCFIELELNNKTWVFSGDVGRDDDLLLPPAKRPTKADYLFIETTYGDRIHPEEDLFFEIEKVVKETVAKGGTLIIPSFAVERTQTLMYVLWQLKLQNRIPDIPLIMDSPMGANVLKVFERSRNLHKLSVDECNRMCNQFKIVEEFKESLTYIHSSYPKVVIAGSGMITGGRVLAYLQHYLEKHSTTVLLAGFQAEGTRGRKLQDGIDELKIYGHYYKVNAEVRHLKSLSAHADRDELIEWLSEIKNMPEKVFLIHGEAKASDAFRVKLADVKKWDSIIPELFQIIEI